MPTFRSRLQGDLLARVLLSRRGEWTISELAQAVEKPLTSVQSEVSRLIEGRVFRSRKIGRTRVITANDANPAIAPLTQLVLITFGPKTVIREEFTNIQADRLIIFGSWAARYCGEKGPTPSDIDLLLVGPQLDRSQAYLAAERAEARLTIPVNPLLRTPEKWNQPDGDVLVTEIKSRFYVDIKEA
ncbi:MAG: ArsR family transcriptional regulator [Angustibacter sp.]